MSNQTAENPFSKWGMWAILTGGLALALVFVQISGILSEPAPSAGTQIGEIAGEIKRSAWRTFLGLPATEAIAEPVPVWRYLAVVAPILGIIAIVLSLISGVRRENPRYPAYGVGLGIAAIVFQYFWWIALLMAGVMLLIAVIENIGDIFSF